MSPRRVSSGLPAKVELALGRACSNAGVRIREERLRRRWTLRQLAGAAGLSLSQAHKAETGAPVSVEAYCRLATALDLRLELSITDARRSARATAEVDVVHSYMGEIEAARLMSFKRAVGIDEPYQHYQFAGRADVVAWDVAAGAFLHIENRTRFPNIQEAAGSWNAKRSYLANEMRARAGVSAWRSVTHVMACLWSGEVLHALRLRTSTFRALCPDPSDAFATWWTGDLPAPGTCAVLVVLDPLAQGRDRRFVDLDRALTVASRHRGYADVASKLLRR
jgi:transcriptional regulator with XRE-family HTH domain